MESDIRVIGFPVGDAVRKLREQYPDYPKREDFIKDGSFDTVGFIKAVDVFGAKLYCRKHNIPWDYEKNRPVTYRAS